MSQVSKMRELYQRFNGDPDQCIAAYAAAEIAGEVARKSNEHSLDSMEYAKRLFYDGTKKGWLNR